MFSRLRSLGLGLIVAGAVLHEPLGAQVRDSIPKIAVPIPPRGDSLLRDTLAKKGPAPPVVHDSIKDPLAHSEMPANITIARPVAWPRDSLFGTGALTLGDLLDGVPGVTTYHAGWIASPITATYMGAFRRIRVFLDGIELQELDPRAGRVLDLSQINMWAAEDAAIEQTPEEVRVYLRSWRARITTPVTRTDVATGDQQTNLYRGFLARRFDNGLAIQAGAQQYGTTPPSFFGSSSDQLGLAGRLGWSNKKWSIDGFFTRTSRHRGVIISQPSLDSIPSVESARTDMYVRVGFGDPDSSRFWAQTLATASRYSYDGNRTFPIANPVTAADSMFAFSSLDTSEYRSQYIANIGTVAGPFRGSIGARVFGGGGQSLVTPNARLSLSVPFFVLSGFAETKSYDSLARADITAKLTSPFSIISAIGSVGIAADYRVPGQTVTSKFVRGEAGIRIFNLWFLGGVLSRDGIRLPPAIVYDTNFTVRETGIGTAYTAAIRGRVWGPIHTDLSGVRWVNPGFYRPQYQTRSELSVRTNLIERIPSGNFGLTFALVHEYRSGVVFPFAAAAQDTAGGYRTFSTLLEIRILSATLSWQFRNFLGERYSQVPFFLMPRQTNFYGVRWEFLN